MYVVYVGVYVMYVIIYVCNVCGMSGICVCECMYVLM